MLVCLAVASELDSAEQDGGREGKRRVRRIIAVGGGKGGAGKSLLAANVGIFLATLGKRVVLLDADLGGANLHTFVGVERPRVTIGDFFAKKVARIEDVVVETPIPGLGLVSGEGDPSWIANPRPAQKHRLLSEVLGLDVDVLVVDLGPGSGDTAIDFFLVADVGVLVVVPEPTSVENTYRFIKSAFLRRLRRAGVELPPPPTEGAVGVPSPLDLYTAATDAGDAALASRLAAEMASFRPAIVVNQVRTRADVELSETLARASWRRLGLAVDDLGHLEADDAVWLAVRKRRPLLVEHATSRVAKGVERVTRRLLALEQDPPPGAPPPVAPTHYEILEIDPAATDEEIRRAHRRLRERYGHDALAVCGLYDRERLAAFHIRVEEAYDTLMDAGRRRAYDRMLWPDGLPRRGAQARPASQPVAARAESAPAAPEADEAEAVDADVPVLAPDEAITGALLRQLREARGVDLRTISQKTKIGVGHLRDIEDERFGAMPAVVYVRGFLTSYARFLRLPVARVLGTYLERYKEARAQLDGEREGERDG